MKNRLLVLGGLFLVGCTSINALSQRGTLVLKPAISNGQYGAKAVVSPYTQSDINHLVLKLFTYDGSEHDQGIQRTLLNAQLDNPVVFSNLKPNLAYRIKAYAYLDASGSTLISLDASPSYTDVVLTNDDRPNLATLSVKLIDRVFSGQGTSSLIISGGYSPIASESMTSPLAGIVTTYAGSSTLGGTNGLRTGATFQYPRVLLVSPAGSLYVAEMGVRVRRIDPNGYVTTFVGSGVSGFTNAQGTSAAFNYPYGMAMDAAGNLYVADLNNHAIRKVDSNANVTTFAGNGVVGSTDGTGGAARLNLPLGLCIDSSGNLFVVELGNNKIRKITPGGVVTTLAGNGTAGFKDGTGTLAQFWSPHGIAIDAQNNLYVADHANHRIRKVTPTGVVTTVAGNGTGGAVDGIGSQATFNAPAGVAVDSYGNLYVSDRTGNYIRKISMPGGVVTTVAGNGSATDVNGTGRQASFNQPEGLAIDASGNLYVGSLGNHLIRRIQ